MDYRSRSADYRIGSIIWAGGLFLVGLILLLFNFGLFVRYEPLAQYILAGLLALSGIGFFLTYFSAQANWAQLIPAWTLLALSVMVLVSTLPAVDPRLNAGLLFFGLALAFIHIYLLNRAERWWALIPGGFMLVLGIVIALSSTVTRVETLGVILFVGMGLVFFTLYAVVGRRQWWALVPGTVLLLFGFFIFTVEGEGDSAWLRWWPVLLMLIGAGIGITAYRRKPAERLTVNAAPSRRGASVKSGKYEPALPEPKAPVQLGEYTRPASGATVEILPDPDDG